MSVSLAERSLNALKWNYLGVVARIGLQLVAQITLARLLGPEPFGLFAAAFLLIGFLGLVADQGVGAALVQKKEIDEEDIRFAFTRLLFGGIAVAALAWTIAEPVASFFGNPDISIVAKGLAPALVLQTIGVVPLSLLKRDLAFKQIQILQVASYGLGFVLVGVVLAIAGAGIWSLVGAWCAQTLFLTASLLHKRPHACRLLIRAKDSTLESFGARVLFTNLCNWTIENVDNLLVGRFFGTKALGLYAVSFNLVKNPANHLVVALQTVLFPTSSRAQDNADGLRRAYLTVLGGVAVVALPMFFGVGVLSETVIEGLFGQAWLPAAPILLPISLAMGFHSIMAIAGPVLWGKGAAGRELQVQLVMALLLILALVVASKISLEAMAWAVFVVYVLRFAGMTLSVMRSIGVPLGQVARAIRGGFLLAGGCSATLLVADHLLRPLGFPAGIRLGLVIAAAAVAAVSIAVAFPRMALPDDLCWAARKVLAKSPRLAQAPIVRRLLVESRNLVAER